MRVSSDERKLRKQLEETRKTLESWDGWSPHEAAGRCLRWLGEDEEAAEHFSIAARKYPVGKPPQGSGLLAAGNLYRLAGEHDEARELFSRGRDLLRARISYKLEDQGDYVDKDLLLTDLTYLDLCCFFLGRYEEVEDVEAFERRLDPDRTISWTGRIARAKRLGDLGEAIRAADEVSEGIRKHRSKVTDTGLVNDWDIYELALETEQELRDERGEGVSGGAEVESEAGETPDLPPSPPPGPTKAELVEYVDSLEYGEVAELEGADLSGADLSGQLLMQAMLADADLRESNLSGSVLLAANLVGADLSGANLDGADLHQVILSGAKLEGVRLSRAKEKNLVGVDLSNTDLSGHDLHSLDLGDADLSGAKLRGANLSGASLYGADLSGADLTGADLHGADLTGADLEGAVMEDVLR